MAETRQTLKRYASYLACAVETFLLRRIRPYLYILVVDDRCNLSCFYCQSRNSGAYDLGYEAAARLLREAYDRGHRALVLTGGEPMMWQDGAATLADLVKQARTLGFFDIAVFTNGTFPLNVDGCRYIVTVDGTREIHESIRPGTYDLILRNVRAARAPVMASVTVTAANAAQLEPIVESIVAAGCFRAITFNLLTDQPDVVARLGVQGDAREAVLEQLWRLKRRGAPIMLSRAACVALKRNDWERPIRQIELGTRQGVYTCCRDVVRPEVCEQCGYSSCVEIAQILRGRPTAWLEMWRQVRTRPPRR
jgi:Fe-coproporphyrin III synthase